MAGYTRNDTSNNIATGNIINASDLDGEFDAIVAAFHASTGHVHDGTAANGAPITKVGPAQEYVGNGTSFSPKTTATYDLGTTSLRWNNAYIASLTLTNALSQANGGTGATSASGARTALGLAIGTDVQAYDAELAALAGLTSAADRLPYFTGSGTAALATFTSFGRSLVDDADASAARSTLGLVIGTNVQAYDAELAALAGLTSAADTVPYFTGSGTAALATFTSFGRSLVDDADASAARSTLGLVIGSNVQAYDAELAALAGLSSSADTVPYFTGSGTAALATFSSFGRSLVDDADASAARSTLGLVIGTNVQAYDAELTALASLSSSADTVPYFTGSGTASLTTLTSFGRSLIDDADASAARSTLGLGSAATMSGPSGSIVGTSDSQTLTNKTIEAGTFTNGYTEETVTANTSTAYTIDLTNGTVQILTLTGNCTFTFPTATAGKSFILFLKQDGTGSRTATWPAAVKWPSATAPTITSTASKADKYVFTADGTNWVGSNAGQNYTV